MKFLLDTRLLLCAAGDLDLPAEARELLSRQDHEFMFSPISLAVLAQQFQPLLADPENALLGLATLTWQPDYLDILPMYLVILALVPVMMLARRLHAALPFLIAVALFRSAHDLLR